MKEFMDENFLLDSESARTLYHENASKMPIYDYHCHICAEEIYRDQKFRNMTEAWLSHDHYKWRAMRSNGVEEDYITGVASDKEKFNRWARTIPYLLGNPLYHWTHLELQRFFDIGETLNEKNQNEIYQVCNQKLQQDDMTVRNLIRKSNVYALCTTDDPVDDLMYHQLLAKEYEVKVLPGFRADPMYLIQKPDYLDYLEKLQEGCGFHIKDIYTLETAMVNRIDYFHDCGCRMSDHGLDKINYCWVTEKEADDILQKRVSNRELTRGEIAKFQSYVQIFLAREYKKRNWAMQLHLGALRDNNSRMQKIAGVNSGFDSIADEPIAEAVSHFLNELESANELPRTILYCLNSCSNEVLATMIGNFQNAELPGKMQFGSGWWFQDQIDGMKKQLETLSQMGMLARFIGMLTDSRSFLSYPRHEYFRRLLCNHIGNLVETGQYPPDMERLGKIVEDICFNNIKRYMEIGEKL